MEQPEHAARVNGPTTVEELAKALDYPVEAAPLASDRIAKRIRMAASLAIASVSVPSGEADLAVRLLEGTRTAAASLVGYPYGAGSTAAKLYEARDLLRRGVKEIEFVVNVGKLHSREFQHVESELLQISASCKDYGAILKVVLETGHLAGDLKVIAGKIAKRVEADIIVSGAYPAPDPGSDEDLVLLKRVSRDVCALGGCAAGLDQTLARLGLGCARIRCASPAAVLQDMEKRLMADTAPSGSGPA